METAIHNRLLKERPDLKVILDIISDGTRVLDLGCGDGSLLYLLKLKKNIKATGVEISQKKILECVEKGIPVIHSDLNRQLDMFSENSYDFVVLSQTLQAVERPDVVLSEMLRIGKIGIVSIINFGYYRIRLQLLLSGRMPMTPNLPYEWYSTPNIHLGTIKDFEDLCKKNSIKIIHKYPLFGRAGQFFNLLPDNLFAGQCVFSITKMEK